MTHVQSFLFNSFFENTFIVWDETKQCAIIDPGCYEDHEKKELQSFIEVNDLKPVALLNTHCHIDHIFGNKWVKETYEVPLLIHEKENIVLQSAKEVAAFYGIKMEESPAADRFIEEGTMFSFGNTSFKILFTPGHSPGSISLYSEENKFVMSGDVLFEASIGRTDLPGGNYDTLMQSIFNDLLMLPDETTIYCGHGPATTIGAERKTNPFILEYREFADR